MEIEKNDEIELTAIWRELYEFFDAENKLKIEIPGKDYLPTQIIELNNVGAEFSTRGIINEFDFIEILGSGTFGLVFSAKLNKDALRQLNHRDESMRFAIKFVALYRKVGYNPITILYDDGTKVKSEIIKFRHDEDPMQELLMRLVFMNAIKNKGFSSQPSNILKTFAWQIFANGPKYAIRNINDRILDTADYLSLPINFSRDNLYIATISELEDGKLSTIMRDDSYSFYKIDNFYYFMIQMLSTLVQLQQLFKFSDNDLKFDNILFSRIEDVKKDYLCYEIYDDYNDIRENLMIKIPENNRVIYKIYDIGLSSLEYTNEYGDKKEFVILFATNNPYIERQTIATQREINKILKEINI